MDNSERFKQFLEENNAYEAFMENLLYEDIEEMIERGIPHTGWVYSAFAWRNTKENHKYWSKLNNK